MKHEDKIPAEHKAEPGKVKVKCIVHTHPWTDTKALEFDEVAEVSEEVAHLLEKRKFVERVK